MISEIERLQVQLEREKRNRIEQLEQELRQLRTGNMTGEGPGIFRLNQGRHEGPDYKAEKVPHGETLKHPTKVYVPGDKVISETDLVMKFGAEKFTRIGIFPQEIAPAPAPATPPKPALVSEDPVPTNETPPKTPTKDETKSRK